MMNYLLVSLASVILAAFVAVGVALVGWVNVAATHKEPEPIQWLLHTSFENSVRSQAIGIEVPDKLRTPSQIKSGAHHFTSMCAGCHRPPDTKETATSMGLNPKPPKANELAKNFTSAELYWVISNGVKMTGMPAFSPSHSNEDIWDLVSFIQEIPYKNYATIVSEGTQAGSPQTHTEPPKVEDAHGHHNHVH